MRTPHLDLISRKVASLAERPLRLIVSMPPRHGKSLLLSNWTPVWYLANWPSRWVGLTSYAADFAETWGRKARDSVLENQDGLGLQIRDDASALVGLVAVHGAHQAGARRVDHRGNHQVARGRPGGTAPG